MTTTNTTTATTAANIPATVHIIPTTEDRKDGCGTVSTIAMDVMIGMSLLEVRYQTGRMQIIDVSMGDYPDKIIWENTSLGRDYSSKEEIILDVMRRLRKEGAEIRLADMVPMEKFLDRKVISRFIGTPGEFRVSPKTTVRLTTAGVEVERGQENVETWTYNQVLTEGKKKFFLETIGVGFDWFEEIEACIKTEKLPMYV